MKSRLTFICLNLVAVSALLGLGWYQTHGGPVILPKPTLLFAILAVYPLTSLLYAPVGCMWRRGDRRD